MVARVVPQSARRRHAESRKPDLWGGSAGGRWPVLCASRYVPWGATRQVENPLRWLCQSPPGPLPAYASPIEPVVSLLYYL